jgi:hypothetical protein
VTVFSARTIFGGCNLPLDPGRLRRPWPLSHLRVTPGRLTVRPAGTRRIWDAQIGDVQAAERFQLSFGQGVRISLADEEWFIYTYESAALLKVLGGEGAPLLSTVPRLKLADLPR